MIGTTPHFSAPVVELRSTPSNITLPALGFERKLDPAQFATNFQQIFSGKLNYDQLERVLHIERGQAAKSLKVDYDPAVNCAAYILALNPQELISSGSASALVWARINIKAIAFDAFDQISKVDSALMSIGFDPNKLLHAKRFLADCHSDEDASRQDANTGFQHLQNNMRLWDQIAPVVVRMNQNKTEILSKWWYRNNLNKKDLELMQAISFSVKLSMDCCDAGTGTVRYFAEKKVKDRLIRYSTKIDGFAGISVDYQDPELGIALPHMRLGLYINHAGLPVVRQVQGSVVEVETGDTWSRLENKVSHLVHGHQFLYGLAALTFQELGYTEMGILSSEANYWNLEDDKGRRHINPNKAIQDFDAPAFAWGVKHTTYPLHSSCFGKYPVYRVVDLTGNTIRPIAAAEIDGIVMRICNEKNIPFVPRAAREHLRLNKPGTASDNLILHPRKLSA